MRRQVVRVLQNFLNSMEFVDVELLGTDLSAVKNFFQYARCAFFGDAPARPKRPWRIPWLEDQQRVLRRGPLSTIGVLQVDRHRSPCCHLRWRIVRAKFQSAGSMEGMREASLL